MWDDACKFVQDGNKKFVEDNLSDDAVKTLDLSVMVFVDRNGKMVYEKSMDLAEGKQGKFPAGLAPHLAAGARLLRVTGEVPAHKGILDLPEGLLLFACHPVMPSDRKGDPKGTLLIGRFLDEDKVKGLAAVTGMQLSVGRFQELWKDEGSEGRAVRALKKAGEDGLAEAGADGRMTVRCLVEDVYGNPCMVVRVDKPMDITNQGRTTVGAFLGMVLAAGLILGLLTMLAGDRWVLRRLLALAKDVRALPDSGRDALQVVSRRKDEVDFLIDEINGMLAARARAETALRASEQHLARAQEIAHVGSWEVDLRTQRARLSAEMRRILGMDPGRPDFSTEEVMTRVRPEDRGTLDQALGKCAAELKPLRVEYQTVPIEGSEKTLETYAEIVTGPDGKAAVMTGVTQDISYRKQIEEQLRQSEKLQAIGALAGGIAHDFNNQLGCIMGYADMLSAKLAKDEKLNRYTRVIIESTQHAAVLTEQLLAFARKGKYRVAEVDVNRLISDVVSLLEHSMDKRIRIHRDFRVDPAAVMGDASQLQNALLNLALNARDAMPEGGDLTFSTEAFTVEPGSRHNTTSEVLPGRYVRISVTDTGVGMDAEVQKHLFEPFFTTKGQGKGTGMGLAAVHGTVRGHHGAIAAYSEKGRGSTFRIYLPLAGGAAVEAASPAPGAQSAAASRSARVLVVDDIANMREMTAAMLRSLGHQVVMRSNGREAVEYYVEKWRETDLVVLDIVMPEMGGREAFARMREINPQARVLLCSGYSVTGEAQEMLDQGAVGFLQKPFPMQSLADQVARALGD